MGIQKKYDNYINDLLGKILLLIPEDVNKLQKKYLENNMKKSAVLLAESMQQDNEFTNLDFENQCFYIQVMMEWSFHKEIDLFRSGIPAKYWKSVMQKIWYVMWEVMYACVKNEASHEVVLTLVERFVNRTYVDTVEELKNFNIIDKKTEEQAKEQSNIEVMARQLRLIRNLDYKIKRGFKLFVLFIVIGIFVSFAIIKFNTYGLIFILTMLALYLLAPNLKK